MKTVYLLKNSPKSFRVLLKLVKIGDITTNIIVVDRFYSKILKKDHRVKEFPFIINTLPMANGLIPKIAKVLPFRIYVQIMKMNMKMNIKMPIKRYNYNTKTKTKTKSFNKKGRTITYNSTTKNNIPKVTIPKLNIPRVTCKKPTIKAIKQKDKSVNIILYNN